MPRRLLNQFCRECGEGRLRVRRTGRAHPSLTLALETLRAVTSCRWLLNLHALLRAYKRAGDNRTPRF